MNNINVSRYQLLCNGKICTKKSRHFHCILCNEEDFPSEHYFKRHLTQIHFNKAHCVRFENIACLPCRNNGHSSSKSKRKINHFHCPSCKKCVRQKGIFLKHLSLHEQNKKYILNEIVGVKNTDISHEDRETINIKHQTENNSPFKIKKNIAAEVESENQDESAEQKAQSISVEKDEQSRRKIKGSSFPIVKCSECGLSIRSNNLKRHIRNKHSSSQYKPFVAHVDKDLAIYMVPKYRSGLRYPIHVQKLLHGSADCKIFCENNFCMDFMRICG